MALLISATVFLVLLQAIVLNCAPTAREATTPETVPTKTNAYGDFTYTNSTDVSLKKEATLQCSGTFPIGSRPKWYRYVNNSYINVLDDYWEENVGIHYQITDSIDFSKQFCTTKLIISSFRKKYEGKYICKVISATEDVLVASEEVHLRLTECEDPTVHGFDARWIEETNSAFTEWKVDPPSKSMWCKSTKLIWSVRYCKWDSIDHVPSDLSNIDSSCHWSQWQKLETKRDSSFTHSELSNTSYFLFQVGRRLKNKTKYDYIYSSRLFHFRQQAPARIVEHGDITVSAGGDAKLVCRASGWPLPKIILVEEPSVLPFGNFGTNPPETPIAEKTYQIFNVQKGKKYGCIADNTIVNSDGKREIKIDSAVINVIVTS